MHWVLLAASSLTLFTSLNLLQRKIAINAEYPRATAIVFNLWAVLLSLVVFFITGSYKNFSLPTEPAAWIFLAIACTSYAIYERWRFVIAKMLDASVLTIVSNISVAFAFIFSLFLYHETLTVGKLVGASLILVALVLISVAKHKQTISLKGVAVAFVVYSILGLGWALDKKGSLYFNPDTYQILVWIVPLIGIYFPYVKLSEIKYEFKVASWKVIVLAGINVIAYLLQLKALVLADATKVIPILQTSTLLTVMLGILLLGEKDNVARKIIASLIALVGSYILITAA